MDDNILENICNYNLWISIFNSSIFSISNVNSFLNTLPSGASPCFGIIAGATASLKVNSVSTFIRHMSLTPNEFGSYSSWIIISFNVTVCLVLSSSFERNWAPATIYKNLKMCQRVYEFQKGRSSLIEIIQGFNEPKIPAYSQLSVHSSSEQQSQLWFHRQ